MESIPWNDQGRYEYEENAHRFIQAINAQIVPSLKEIGCHCSTFTLSEARAEDLNDDTVWEDVNVQRQLNNMADNFDAKRAKEGFDRAELLITGPIDTIPTLANQREVLSRLAREFGGSEFKWILEHKKSNHAFVMEVLGRIPKKGMETEARLIASYKFEAS